MIKPDVCTSMICTPPNKHCVDCYHAFFFGVVESCGVFYSFEFNPQYGVEFLTKKGVARKRQPIEIDPIWDEFNKWHDDKFKRT